MYWPKNQGFFRAKSNIAPGNPDCKKCGLYKNVNSPRMKYSGEGRLGILIVGEAPGEKEDLKGTQFVGDAGSFLRRQLNKFGLDLDRDFYKTNSICCRPPKNRDPSIRELKCCYPILKRTISILKPKQIWLMGRIAIQAMFGGAQTISKWIREYIPDYKNGYWVIPMYHPSFLMRREYDSGILLQFRNGIKKALSLLDVEVPNYEEIFKSNIKQLLIPESVVALLEDILKYKHKIVIDYETTGLDLYKRHHELLTIGVKPDDDYSYSFPIFRKDMFTEDEIKHITQLWKSILVNPKIKKIAHNLKYEDLCSRFILGVKTKGWVHDTMICAHVLNENPKTKGLKHQAFVKFGIRDYDKSIHKYIEGRDKNGKNLLPKAPLNLLLTYNAMDVEVTSNLYKYQIEELNKDKRLSNANKFFLRGVLTLCDAEEHGICVDEDYYKSMEKELSNLLKITLSRFYKIGSKEIEKVERVTGAKFNVQSNDHLKVLFYKVLGFKPFKLTKKSGESTDHEALSHIDHKLAKTLVGYRNIAKVKSTYLSGFLKNCYNGKIHPNWNLHTTRTYRSSSDNPNLQNIPRQDNFAKMVCRSGIIPSRGNKIGEVDYSSLEVRIAACETKDPVLIKYICDDDTDMHWDQAKEIFLVDDGIKKEAKGLLRYISKNGFVFPEFYGSYFVSCAKDIWERLNNIDIDINGMGFVEYLKSKGIGRYDRFERHLKAVEDRFWKKYSEFKKWVDWIINFYNRHGYVRTAFGFKRYGPLDKEQIINTPIQSTAFHCLLWSLTQINKWIKKNKWKTRVIGQIHDSGLFDIFPEEEEDFLRKVVDVSCYDIRERFKFLIVPLEVEIEMTEIDGSWYEKKEIENRYYKF